MLSKIISNFSYKTRCKVNLIKNPLGTKQRELQFLNQLTYCYCTMSESPTYINEAKVLELLSWPPVFEASEQALRSVCKEKMDESQPMSLQPPRPHVELKRRNGLAFSMLGYIDNYRLSTVDPNEIFDTLGHKLVTAFGNNKNLAKPLPNIMGTIFLFDTVTGKLKTIVEATEITAWRTAASCMVATKYLYFDRLADQKCDKILSILGCGVQGRIHAIGICTMFPIKEVHLCNRTKSKADELMTELEKMKSTFKNSNVKIFVHESIEDCVKTADVIVTATHATTPILFPDMLKDRVHINAVGASKDHHSEIDLSLYKKSKLYVDSWTGAKSELKTLDCDIVGEVGEIINKSKKVVDHPITIFHSLGMAVVDAAVAQVVETLYHKQ